MATPMATRSIVTSRPDVACDVCGRRLLRGERPDVFLASGQRRTVCELCAPRATHEGWLREADQLRRSVSLPPTRPRRGRNLLERLRQLREPAGGSAEQTVAVTAAPVEQDAGSGSEPYDFFDAGPSDADPVASVPVPAPALEPPLRSSDLKMELALESFNAGEHPRRIAGVARSLGVPTVTVRPLAESESTFTIVVAWELCWYRYAVDLDDEATGAEAVAQGTELSELDAEDKLANAVADALGMLSLSPRV